MTTAGNTNLEALLSEADRRLHAAKRRGRDRVVATPVPTAEIGAR